MTYRLNEKVKNLIPYDAVSGDYQIRLDANESFINPGELLEKEIVQAVSQIDFNRYPDAAATKLREKVGAFYGVDPSAIVVGNGSDELISIILGAFLMQGDKLLIFDQDFSMYEFYGKIYERQCGVAEKTQDLTLDAEKVLSEIKAFNPELLLLSNPCSPTSLVIRREEIKKILAGTDALVIIDEAYMEFSNESVLDLISEHDNLIVLKTCSKALGLAAIRLGFAISSGKIVKALNSIRSPYNVSAITQAVGCVVFSKPAYIKYSIAKIIESRDALYEALIKYEKAKGVKKILKPETNFVYMEMENAEFVYNELLKASIIVRRFNNYLRITAGSKEENQGLIMALSKIFNESL